MDSFDNIQCEEYETAFPEEAEYQAWIASIEQDYIDECNYQAKLAITNKIKLYFDDGEELSPFSTVNS